MRKEELKASESILKLKSEELVGVKGKLASAEDLQERLLGQIVKDANQISDLSSQVSILSKELIDVKDTSQSLISLYCELVTSFGGQVDPPPSSLSAKDLLGWLRSEVKGLSEILLRASYFGALSCANNMLYSLCKMGVTTLSRFFEKVV